MNKNWILIFFIFSGNLLIAQKVDISILKFKDYYKGDEPTWTICNNDSQFFNNDTVLITSGWFSEELCCDILTFKIRRKKLTEIYFQLPCNEPPLDVLYVGNDYRLSGKIKKKHKNYDLNFSKGTKPYLEFKIIELTKEKYYDKENYQREYLRMKLVRQK
ncbi:MAG: hypothetical protein ACXWDO_02145 [Bacteroidia bacterium]